MWQHVNWNFRVSSPILSLFPADTDQKWLNHHLFFFSHAHLYQGQVCKVWRRLKCFSFTELTLTGVTSRTLHQSFSMSLPSHYCAWRETRQKYKLYLHKFIKADIWTAILFSVIERRATQALTPLWRLCESLMFCSICKSSLTADLVIKVGKNQILTIACFSLWRWTYFESNLTMKSCC